MPEEEKVECIGCGKEFVRPEGGWWPVEAAARAGYTLPYPLTVQQLYDFKRCAICAKKEEALPFGEPAVVRPEPPIVPAPPVSPLVKAMEYRIAVDADPKYRSFVEEIGLSWGEYLALDPWSREAVRDAFRAKALRE